MKTRIGVLQAPPDPRFVSVARIVAKGKAAPEWLAIGLEHFSGFVGGGRVPSKEYEQYEKIIERMHDAADKLIKFLPIYANLPAGIQCPSDVATALDVLPRIKKDLARALQNQRSGGPRPNVQRWVCAAVVVETWRLVRGKPEPRSQYLLEACNEYWRACGGKSRGSDIENWRRDAERAIIDNHEWIRKTLTTLKAVHN
jgi:hypothetical protein